MICLYRVRSTADEAFYSLSVIVLSVPIDVALEMDRHARGGKRRVSAQNFEIDISRHPPTYTKPQPTYPLHWAATSLMSVTLPHMLLSLDLRGRCGLKVTDVSSSKAPPTATM